ncbi:MAG TPA: hypothetical protein VF855_13920 [Acidimicrobiales bacterium]
MSDLPEKAPTTELADAAPGGRTMQHIVRTDEADLDGDGKVDAVTESEIISIDTDGDGKVDTIVMAQTTVVDVDGDGIVDMAHRTEKVFVDFDGDGIADVGREVEVTAFDSNGDGTFDDVVTIEREGIVVEGEIVEVDDES